MTHTTNMPPFFRDLYASRQSPPSGRRSSASDNAPVLPSRRTAITVCLLTLAGAFTLPLSAASNPDKHPFKIAAGTAPQALAEFIRQTGLQVLFDFDAISTSTTHEVTGQLAPQEALSRMLEGTGLTFEFINARTISVRPRPPTAVPVSQPAPEPT